MQPMRVRWEYYQRTVHSTHYGTIVGYIRDYHNRPCAIVLVEDKLEEVQLEDLTVLSEEKFQEEVNNL